MARPITRGKRRGIPDWFIDDLQAHQARVSITASSVRSQGSGTARITREFLGREFNLRGMRATSERAYLRKLDAATNRLRRRLKGRAKTFGLARKLINIYIRDCVYSRYLNAEYRLESVERFLEVPLDGVVGKRLWQASNQLGHGSRLPRWKSIRALTREDSDQYQAFAAELAGFSQLDRVHLDVSIWGARRG